MWADGWTLAASGAGLLALVGLGEMLRRRGWRLRTSRNVVHAGVGLFVVATPSLFATPEPVYVLAVGFVALNAVALHRSWWRGIHGGETRSPGTVTFPLVLIPALAATWSLDPERIEAFQVAFLVLATADPVAAWMGARRSAAHHYTLSGAPKTVAGNVAFGLVSWVVSTGALVGFWAAGMLDGSLTTCFGAGAVVGLVTTAVEALSGRGWDNFFIVIAVLAVLIPLTDRPEAWMTQGGGVAAGGAFAAATYRMRVLDTSGAVAGGLFAAALIGLGGWAWAIPGFAFFVLSSGLSQVGRQLKSSMIRRSEKGSVRDAGQVYANGGVAWGALLIYVAVPSGWLYVGFLGTLAAAAADTWATELGALSPRRPRLLRTGQRVPRGTSGGVSVTGTLAAGIGAASIAISAAPFWTGFVDSLSAGVGVGLIVASGLVGAVVDSWAGATLQAQYRDPETGALTEQPGREGERFERVRGWAAITNDRVNWMGTTAGALIAIVGVLILSGG